ncbi:hypothetical protein INR49_030046, partial [Caranx melampygus]
MATTAHLPPAPQLSPPPPASDAPELAALSPPASVWPPPAAELPQLSLFFQTNLFLLRFDPSRPQDLGLVK